METLRNMVISERDMETLRFETCNLHDMMREVCLLKAKEENFLQIVDCTSTTNTKSPCKSRRLAVYLHDGNFNVMEEMKNPGLRSLLFINLLAFGESYCMKWDLFFTRLQLMRVLDLCGTRFEGRKLLCGIGKLIHLRYLSLENAYVSYLPSSLGNLKLLIYLNLNIMVGAIFVPNVLMGTKELRYLALPRFMPKKTKLELGNLVKLETLENFSPHNSSLEDLSGMARLRTLGIRLTGETCLETLSASTGGLRHLEKLHINGHEFDKKIETGFVLDAVNLRQLVLLDIYMPKFPDERHFPSQLTTIYLEGCHLEEDPMPILEKLIQLKVVELMPRSFCGRRMVCSNGRFPQLQKLVFYHLDEWEEWIVEEGSMPLLHKLIISDCPQLKELPDGLRFIPSLKDLICHNMGEEWKGRLSEGGEDYYKVQHIPSLTFSENETNMI